MKWILAVVLGGTAACVAAAYRIATSSRRDAARPLPERVELLEEIERLEREIGAARERGDEEALRELTLRLRVKRHWLRKVEDPSWKEYYEQTSGRALDEWGKTGAK